MTKVCNLSMGIYTKGKLEILFNLVKKNLLSIPLAAQQMDMTPSVFEKEYKTYMKECQSAAQDSKTTNLTL